MHGKAFSKPDDAPAWVLDFENPYLRGIHAPTATETTSDACPTIAGELPTDLEGALVRNGPNANVPPSNLYHWFDGDGMVHGVYFRNGQARYRSRWIRTRGLAAEARASESLWPGVMGPFDTQRSDGYIKDTANTDLVWHHGNLLALWYLCGTPYRIDPLSLDTLGPEDFGGALGSTVSAHPKVDPRTGELVYFTLSDFEPPFMRYGVVSREGELVHEIPIDLPGPRAPHDITITEHHSILHDFPFFHDTTVLREHGYRVARFHRDLPTRFGVIPRRGDADRLRWFEFEPGYVLHMVNAWEDGDWIVMDGCLQPDPGIRRRKEEGELASMLGYLRINSHLHRWRMNLRTGQTSEEALDDLNVEFPLPDTERYGEHTRFSYLHHLPADAYTVDFRALVKYDHESGASTRYDYPTGWFGGEAPFAPRRNSASEDDGYVISLMTHGEELRSECWIFDAREIERGPVARIALPQRVPSGFHAKWITNAQLRNEPKSPSDRD
ncbi:carotenoid oxygenase family protein [Myxococcota bacterium]|nr:carotenoid oxygenase family protein [Myxococcota bacterium]